MAGEIYRGNSAISAIYRGNTAVSNVYRGNTEVWSPSAAGFDPTLGGTLTVNHWFNFTDSSTMTLSGNDITAINDQGSATSYNLDETYVNPSQDNGIERPVFDSTNGYTIFGPNTTDSSPLSSVIFNSSDAPTTIGNSPSSGTSQVTMVTILTYYNTGYSDLQRIIAIGNAGSNQQDFNPIGGDANAPMPVNTTYLNSTAATGRAYGSIFRSGGFICKVFGNQGAFGDVHVLATSLSWNGSVLTSGHSIDGSNFFTGLSSKNMGGKNGNPAFIIGGRREAALTRFRNPFTGYMYHTIVYDGILTNTNIADINTAWTSL